MAITYPLVAPTDTIGPESISLRLVTADTISGSPFTYKQQVINLGGSRWEASLSIPPVNKEMAEVWISFLLSLKGRTGTLLIGDPMGAVQQGFYSTDEIFVPSLNLDFTLGSYAVTGASLQPVVDGAGQLGDTVNLRDLPFSTNAVFKPGDYIQIGVGSAATLHKVLTTTNSDIDGKATVDIAPDLRKPTIDGQAVITSNPKGVFRLKDNTVEWSIDKASRYGISFDIVEALT